MPITKRPTPAATHEPQANEEAVNSFIQGAPDAKPSIPLGVSADPSGKNSYDAAEQITIRIPKSILDRATAMAGKQGIPRASYIKRALALQLLKDEAE